MKILGFGSSLLLVTLSAGAVALAAPDKSTAIVYPASRITVQAWDALMSRRDSRTIVAGTSRDVVQRELGRPREALSSDVWVYDKCLPDHPDARADGCDLLIVRFQGDKVTEMKFVNRPMATIIAANIKATGQDVALR